MMEADKPGAGVPRIGLIADSDLKLHLLQSVLQAAGYVVPLTQQAASLDKKQLQQKNIDAWVVEVEEQDESDKVDELSELQTSASDGIIELIFEYALVPVLVGDGVPLQTAPKEHERWQRRLKEKLKPLAVAGSASDRDDKPNPIIQRAHSVASEQNSAEHVWVLAASMGGPEAVKDFLDALPADLPVAFVYAQHIDDENDELLAKVLGRHNDFEFSSCSEGSKHSLRHGQVSIVPTDHVVRFLAFGKVANLVERWPSPFSPCIDQVIEDVALRYKERSGVIVFSGMSNDGAKGTQAMRQHGGEVWAQLPETCICSSMPDSALETGCVSFSATPKGMAQALKEKFASEYIISEARDNK